MLDFKEFLNKYETEKEGYWELIEKNKNETAEQYSERIEKLIENKILNILEIYTNYLNDKK